MLRKRKTRGYNETNDEEDDGGRKYDVREKIRSERFNEFCDLLQELYGTEITLKQIQSNGFTKPMLVREPEGLELRVPQKGFLVRDVRDCVGGDRIIDVMDVRTQKNIEMSMKDWCKYYESKRRDRLLNVISLEFSHTELDDLVEAPSIVRLLDWVDQVWPKFLKESQTESTNKIDKMKYPKVQKYCLMSVKGSYTDFHIDFGGTSVWYHVLKGKKIFWMVPPTELNLTTYEEWTLSGMQQEVFFGDLVEECFRVELTTGNTFFIPSGWIHAVYTLEDSLVFGGNFLHSFGIENQLKVSKVEDATKVPVKFRYPFYTEIQWYVVQHYVHCLTGKDHLHPVSKSANCTPEKLPEKVASKPKSNKNRNKKNDDDDDTETGSEIEESDINEAKLKPNNTAKPKGSKFGKPAKGRAVKRKGKPPSDDETDDESDTEIDTEVDSDNEDHNSKKPTTCRMTKNSLLRLQYEVGQPVDEKKSTSNLSKQPDARAESSSRLKCPPRSTEKHVANAEPPASKTTFDLDKFMYSQDTSSLNGWSSTLNHSNNQTSWSNPDAEPKKSNKIHMTKYELNGLRSLVKHLSKLSGAKKNLPALIRNSRNLLDDCKKMIAEHENDDPGLATTGYPITIELLNPKKSDMNQLIEQFFKPTETTVHDDTRARLESPKPKTDSFMNHNKVVTDISDKTKVEDGVSLISGNDSPSVRKDAKPTTSPSKRLFGSTNASSSAASSASFLGTLASTAGGSSSSCTQPARPKSPPTRPLSNNQYTSKTKKNNSLILPGSFADLIAATSTEKKVFDVDAADVTSTLFGTKESQRPAGKTAGSLSPQKSLQSLDPFDILKSPTSNDIKSSNAHTSPAQETRKESQPLKTNSPEPPKLSPPKRFINPSFKPQNKEKLIFASAPYVSPITVSSQSRANIPYMWPNLAPMQQPQPQLPQQRNHNQPPSPHKPQGPAQIVAKPQLGDHPEKHSNQTTATKPSLATDQQKTPSKEALSKPPTQACSSMTHAEDLSRDCLVPQSKNTTRESNSSPKIKPSNNESTDVIAQDDITKTSQARSTEQINHDPKPENVKSGPVSSNESQLAKKTTKPRGPPKKSKEARLAIVSSPPRPIVTKTQRYLLTPTTIPVVAGPSTAPIVPDPKVTAKPTNVTPTIEREKPNPKRTKKQNDAAKTAVEVPPPSGTHKIGPQQSIICGLVAPPVGPQSGSVSSIKTPQQYLISRPLLFNTMPPLSTAHLQQLPRASLPLLSTARQAPIGLAATQPGARIVWATQPRPQVSAPVANSTNALKQTAVTSVALGARPPVAIAANSAIKNPTRLPTSTATATAPENAALLSLATTALSTASLPTSSTLSYPSSIRAPTGQAIMVSSATGQPALLTGQQFFSPFMPRLPMAASHFPTVGIMPPVNTPGLPTRPFIANNAQRPTGQLVFARLLNQNQPRYLITQPYLQPRAQVPSTTANLTNQPMAFAPFIPRQPGSDGAAKESIKTKKVKTR